jgi:hypothetical protein
VAVSGAYDGEERASSTTNDVFLLACDSHILGANASCSVEVLCPFGPDRGIAEILVNGVSQGVVDLYAASVSQNHSVMTATVPSGQAVSFRVTGTKNASSSAVKCGINAFRVTYAP